MAVSEILMYWGGVGVDLDKIEEGLKINHAGNDQQEGKEEWQIHIFQRALGQVRVTDGEGGRVTFMKPSPANWPFGIENTKTSSFGKARF